jgi:plasmid stabilization system protein ParE
MASHVGYIRVPAVAGPVTVDWSDEALADLNRFAAFLHEHFAELAPVIADAIIARTELLAHHPQLGRPIAGREEYRQLVLEVLGGAYVFQYRFDSARVVILRVFHARERRDGTDSDKR